jgi:glycerol-3-phosphate acyltransferase PlsY
MIPQWFPYAFGAYVLGSIPFGRIVAKLVARIDITRRGSGNIGATNVARELGLKWGTITLILDLLKGLVPVLAFAHYALDAASSSGLAFVCVSALLGHQFSVFQKFDGGKGVATALGAYLAVSPLSCLLAVILFVVVVAKWKYISLGSIVGVCAMPLLLIAFGEEQALVISSAVTAALIFWKHRENIQRLSKGTENEWRKKRRQESKSNSLSSSSSE